MTDRAVVIIQARMGSTRLPGKIMREVCGKPLLAHLLDRLSHCRETAELAVATTTDASDDLVASFARDRGVSVVRGPVDDVLARFGLAAEATGADIVVRVTADCPLLSPETVDAAARMVREGGYDYVSTGIAPVTYPNGLGCEAFSRAALERALAEATDRWDREHVTTYIKRPEARFQCGGMALASDHSRLRVTVDTQDDLALVSRVLETLYIRDPLFSVADVIALLDAHPEWQRLNAHVVQKSRPDDGER